MKNYKIVIFDLDGTLVDSLEGLRYSLNKVLEQNSLPTHSNEEYNHFLGRGLKQLVKDALPEKLQGQESLENYYQQMLETYKTHWEKDMDLYEGIDSLLDYLVESKKTIAINTNKKSIYVGAIVEGYLNKWEFSHVIAPGEEFPHKPNPAGINFILESLGYESEDCLFVGDTEVDIETAKNAGIDCIGVTWGFRQKEFINSLGYTHIVDHPKEIIEYIKQ